MCCKRKSRKLSGSVFYKMVVQVGVEPTREPRDYPASLHGGAFTVPPQHLLSLIAVSSFLRLSGLKPRSNNSLKH